MNPDIATWLHRWFSKAFKVCFPWTKSIIFAKRHVINQCLHLLLWIFTNVFRTKSFTYDLEQVISTGLKPQKAFTLFKMCFTHLNKAVLGPRRHHMLRFHYLPLCKIRFWTFVPNVFLSDIVLDVESPSVRQSSRLWRALLCRMDAVTKNKTLH